MKTYNSEGMMIPKAPLVDNKTSKIKINTFDDQCFALIAVEDKNWL